MGESVRLVRIRGRGPALLQLRVIGVLSAALLGSATWSALAPDTGGPTAAQRVGLGAVVLAAVLWQLWLFRPSVEVGSDDVLIRDVWSTTAIPLGYVVGFEPAVIRLPLDVTARTVALVVRRSDGPPTVVRWVAWMDMISPLLTGATRPPTASQQKVVARLEDALAAARGVAGGADGASSAPH